LRYGNAKKHGGATVGLRTGDVGWAVDRVERRIELPLPPEEVWPAVSEGRRISEWFGATSDLRPEPGSRATFRWPDDRERGAVVETVEPGRRLTIRWLPIERLPDGRTVVIGPGRIELALEPAGTGSVLTVTEWGPTDARLPELQATP
jgi:uncharacterized protein YndB with AHSA1/START domain